VTGVSTTLVKTSRAMRSTITLKLLMAGSGLVIILFVLTHMYGNLKAFAGHDAFNEYAGHIRSVGEPMIPHGGLLWVLRVVLFVSVVVHAYAAAKLWARAIHARPVRYQVKRNLGSSFSSRWMRWGGITLLLFLLWHLLNFTVGKINVTGGATGDPYELVVDSFSTWWLTLIYLIAMATLGLHLHHGTFSAFQTLGLTNTPASRARARLLGWIVAIGIAGGFSLVPLFTLFGVIDK
jgi:succinate dehydrogenase / fumarate reductase cytochrome b subunit